MRQARKDLVCLGAGKNQGKKEPRGGTLLNHTKTRGGRAQTRLYDIN